MSHEANFLMFPRFHNVWAPMEGSTDASFYFAELLATIPEQCDSCGSSRAAQRAYHVVVVSADGSYIGPVNV